MASDQCKQPERGAPQARRHVLPGLLLVALAGLLALSACGTHNRSRGISVDALEASPAMEPRATRRGIISAATELEDLYYPLGRRLGLLQVRTADDWERLRRCAPELGPAPDLERGIVIGLVSHAGLPLSGTWPVHIEAVRMHNGAGFAIARFQGGTFLPDGTTYVETAQFEDLAAVLMVEVNGTRFYPQ